MKSIQQIEALLIADLGTDRLLANVKPKVELNASANATDCNWEVTEWIGLPARSVKIQPRLTRRVADLQRRYRAISSRQ